MPKKKKPTPPAPLRTSDFVRFVSQAELAFERVAELDPDATDLLGDAPALRRAAKAILSELRAGGIVIFPPLAQAERTAGPGVVGKIAKGKTL